MLAFSPLLSPLLRRRWTSFRHPDPESEQLVTAQKLLTTIRKGGLRSLFATEEEWNAYHLKEANRFMNFPEVTAEGMAEDVKDGYVWLDYSSVPQAKEAEEARLSAIGTIPGR